MNINLIRIILVLIALPLLMLKSHAATSCTTDTTQSVTIIGNETSTCNFYGPSLDVQGSISTTGFSSGISVPSTTNIPDVNITGSVSSSSYIGFFNNSSSFNNLTITSGGGLYGGSYGSVYNAAGSSINQINVIGAGSSISSGSYSIFNDSGSSIGNISLQSGGSLISANDGAINNDGSIGTISVEQTSSIETSSGIAVYNRFGSIDSLINQGSILSANAYGESIYNGAFASVTSLVNGVTGEIIGGQAPIIGVDTIGGYGIDNAGNIGNITNSGLITAYATRVGGAIDPTDQFGIAILNQGTLGSLTNNAGGTILGEFVAITNTASGNITNIVNRNGGTISSSYYAIGNDGVIDRIENAGSISGARDGISNTGTINGILNSGVITGNAEAGVLNFSSSGSAATISAITNTGSITSSSGKGIWNDVGGTIGVLNNLQGKGNVDGPLTFTGVLPSNYNIIINSPSVFGRLSAASVTGPMAFNIYGNTGTTLVSGVNASVVSAGTYEDVLQGFSSLSGITGIAGTYSGLNYSLVADTTTVGCIGCWDLVFTPNSTDIIASTGNYLAAVGSSLNPVFAGGTLTLLNGDNSNQNFAVESTGGTIASPTSGSATLSGVFSGPGGMTFNGSGTTYMNGVSTYTGGTTVASGILSVGSSEANNTARLAGDVTVQAAGTLAGHGGIGGNVVNSGTVAPGGSIGTLSVGGNYSQNAGGMLSTSITPTENSVLAVSGKANIAGNFVIDASAGTYGKKVYTVLTSSGLSGSFSGVSGNLSSYSSLGTYLSYDANNAYLELVASRADTQQSLANTASVLQGIYTLQNSVLVNGFSYDCNLFGANNICVAAGGRNTSVQAEGVNNNSALLIAAYRPHLNYRFGAWADQNLSLNSPGGTVKLGNNTPVLGLFGAWNQRLDGTGTELKVSAGYGQKDATVTRSVVGTSDPGSGSSNLTTQGAQVQAKYGFAIGDSSVVSPYAGMRYTQSNMGGYSEGYNSNVTAPLTYQALNTNATTAIAGLGVTHKPIPVVTLLASAGVESDTNTSNGTYNAYSVKIPGLTPISFNANPVKTRPTASVGVYYDVEKNQRLGITGIYRQEPFQAVSTTTVMATYTIGM